MWRVDDCSAHDYLFLLSNKSIGYVSYLFKDIHLSLFSNHGCSLLFVVDDDLSLPVGDKFS